MPVARPSDKQGDLLFQWPSPLSAADTVTVAEGEKCVSMQFGQALGIFEPGVHRLPAEIPDGVELWFCTTRGIMGQKFGGKLPTGNSVFGDYAFRISAPHLLIPNISAMVSSEGLNAYLDRTVVTALGTAFGGAAPDPAGLGSALDRAAAGINAEWEALGLTFMGFGTVDTH